MRTKKQKLEQPELIEQPQILQKPIGEFAEEAYLDYGNYVNNYRHMPYMRDGLKISYKRLIYAALQFPKDKFVPTQTLISSVANWHPHGLTGIEGSNATLTKSGVFEGDGFFGQLGIDGTEDQWAAPRYTKNKVSDVYWEIIGDLIKEVPYVESPVGALEPAYIPLPLPMCLYMSDQVSGLGVGISTIFPNFSPQSLYNAYMANDPNLLEPNINILMDKTNSELQKLWLTGKGRVIYSYKVTRQKSHDGKTEGVLFEGDTGIFVPNLKRVNKLVEDGKIYHEDLTDQNGPKLFIGKIPGARNITIEDIEKLASKICYNNTQYVLNVSDGTSAFRIPLYNWLDYTYKNYINLVTGVNQKRINSTLFDITVQESIPLVVEYIMTKNPAASNKEIEGALGLSSDVVSAVMSKPISYLRKNKDTSERVKALKKKLAELKKFDAVQFTHDIIQCL